jgi:hypothetical protein
MRQISLIILVSLVLVLAVGCGPSEIGEDAVVKAIYFWADT